MANTFLHAQGVGVGKSLAEKDPWRPRCGIIAKAEAANCAIILPVDAIVATTRGQCASRPMLIG
jgi:phosphoglycerate kinase